MVASAGCSWSCATAETPSGDPNGWFIGFASFDAPSVAFAAVFEQFHESPGNFASQVAGTAVRTLLGAKFGESQVPDRWAGKLKAAPELLTLAEQLYKQL